MAPTALDENSFNRFVADNDAAVIGLIEEDGDAELFSGLAPACISRRACRLPITWRGCSMASPR
jgi:hypothetical protein